ncbi:spore coat protein U domain-containing protein [Acinetobacter portensis]|uniref:spore coat protein U domain-containing protein n=1 Tax=Acinetobacter portensis TaxID=1839785 RepID=UPI0013D7D79C|nr:spore coat protein U domain-containing protein [Acinetobacter portensis]
MKKTIVKFGVARLFSILIFFIAGSSFAGQGQMRLNSTLNLVPACLINGKTVVTGTSDRKFGDIDFGDQSAGFSSVNTTLTNEFNAIKIHCPVNSRVSVSFSAGQNSANVPNVNKSKAERAMTDGAGHYIAYQIYRDNKNGVVLSPQTQLSFDGGVEQQVRIYSEAYNAGGLVKGQYIDQITVTVAF